MPKVLFIRCVFVHLSVPLLPAEHLALSLFSPSLSTSCVFAFLLRYYSFSLCLVREVEGHVGHYSPLPMTATLLSSSLKARLWPFSPSLFSFSFTDSLREREKRKERTDSFAARSPKPKRKKRKMSHSSPPPTTAKTRCLIIHHPAYAAFFLRMCFSHFVLLLRFSLPLFFLLSLSQPDLVCSTPAQLIGARPTIFVSTRDLLI